MLRANRGHVLGTAKVHYRTESWGVRKTFRGNRCQEFIQVKNRGKNAVIITRHIFKISEMSDTFQKLQVCAPVYSGEGVVGENGTGGVMRAEDTAGAQVLKEENKREVVKDLMRHIKYFEFYSEGNGNLCKVLSRGAVKISVLEH